MQNNGCKGAHDLKDDFGYGKETDIFVDKMEICMQVQEKGRVFQNTGT